MVTLVRGMLTPATGMTPQASPSGSDARLILSKDTDLEQTEVWSSFKVILFVSNIAHNAQNSQPAYCSMLF